MNLRTLESIPPWEWTDEVAGVLLDALRDERAPEADLLLAAELSGNTVVINENIVAALLALVRRADLEDETRATAAISLGPVLEECDTFGFEDDDELPIDERTFDATVEALRQVYLDAGVPLEVRRRVLEASVRAPQDWHVDTVRAAYDSDDERWKLTGVFCMRFVGGFTPEILEALDSVKPEMVYEAILAAGNWEVDAAWPYVAGLITAEDAEKPLRLAAIEAATGIRPQEAIDLLEPLIDDPDEDIAEAASEGIAIAGGMLDFEEDDEDELP